MKCTLVLLVLLLVLLLVPAFVTHGCATQTPRDNSAAVAPAESAGATSPAPSPAAEKSDGNVPAGSASGTESRSPPPAPEPGRKPEPSTTKEALPVKEAPKKPTLAQEEEGSPLEPPQSYFQMQFLYAKATDALRRGDARTAEDALNQALTIDPEYREAAYAKAKICRADHRYDEAVRVLDRALKADPGDASLLYEKALALYEQGENSSAAETLQKIFDHKNKMPDGRYLLARILASEKDTQGTLNALQDAVDNGFLDLLRMEKDDAFLFLHGDERFAEILRGLRREVEAAAEMARKATTQKIEKAELPPEAERPADPRELLVELKHRLSRNMGQHLGAGFQGIDGQPVAIPGHEGKVVVVEVWGPWSRQSAKELPHLARLRDEFRDKGLEVLTLSYVMTPDSQDAMDLTAIFLRKKELDLPCVVIPRTTATYLRVDKFPCTIFFGRSGEAYLWATGYKDYETLRALAQELLAQDVTPPEKTAEKPAEEAPKPGGGPEKEGEKTSEKQAEKADPNATDKADPK